ncbi:MAG: Lsm family RNA-binding protein [Candidatus Kariarchaeaceae archaeon]|jgi:small nuclear ribonucleoprotein (snRNP)-like protein
MSINLTRNFKNELNTFAGKNVIIETLGGKKVQGVLVGLNTEDMSLILGDAIVNNERHHRIFLSGATIAEIYLGEAPFDLLGLRTELEKVFKKSGVRYFEDTQTLLVMDRYKVTQEGVEGDGPVADRVRRIWNNFSTELPVTEPETED